MATIEYRYGYPQGEATHQGDRSMVRGEYLYGHHRVEVWLDQSIIAITGE